MHVSAWQMSNSSTPPSIYLPPLSALVSDPPDESTELSMNSSPTAPPGQFSRGASNTRLPSIGMILESINNADLAQRTSHMPDYAASHIRSSMNQFNFNPKNVPWGPDPGLMYRPSHVRSLSLSNFQFASTISDKSRSYSFSYTPVRFLQSEEAGRSTEIHEGAMHRGGFPRGSVGKKRGRKKKADVKCGQCLSENTPEWRRGPNGSRTLCNACGLFYSKLTKKFGYEDANIIFAYKKKHNEVLDRIVPTTVQRDRFVLEQRDSQ